MATGLSMSAWSWLVTEITDSEQQGVVIDAARLIATHRQVRAAAVSDVEAAAFRLGYLPSVPHELTITGDKWTGYRGACSCFRWGCCVTAQRSEIEADFREHLWAVTPPA